jgi:transposase
MEGWPMETYPVEYRRRVIALTEQGKKTGEIAAVLGVAPSWVRSIKRLHRLGQSLEPKSRANHRRSLAQREGERLRARVAAHPGTTLEDLQRDLGLKESITNIWYALRALGLSLKKKRSTPKSGSVPTSSSRGQPGKSSKPASTRGASFSSTKPSARRR